MPITRYQLTEEILLRHATKTLHDFKDSFTAFIASRPNPIFKDLSERSYFATDALRNRNTTCERPSHLHGLDYSWLELITMHYEKLKGRNARDEIMIIGSCIETNSQTFCGLEGHVDVWDGDSYFGKCLLFKLEWRNRLYSRQEKDLIVSKFKEYVREIFHSSMHIEIDQQIDQQIEQEIKNNKVYQFELLKRHGTKVRAIPEPVLDHARTYLDGGASAQQKTLLLKRIRDYTGLK